MKQTSLTSGLLENYFTLLKTLQAQEPSLTTWLYGVLARYFLCGKVSYFVADKMLMWTYSRNTCLKRQKKKERKWKHLYLVPTTSMLIISGHHILHCLLGVFPQIMTGDIIRVLSINVMAWTRQVENTVVFFTCVHCSSGTLNVFLPFLLLVCFGVFFPFFFWF